MPDPKLPHKEFGQRRIPEISPPSVVHNPLFKFPEVDLNQPLIRKMGLALGLWTMGTIAALTLLFNSEEKCSSSGAANRENCRSSHIHISGGGGYGTSNKASGFGGFGHSGMAHGGGG